MPDLNKKKRSFFSAILLIINFILIAAILISDSANFIKPRLFWAIGLLGMSFPFLVFFNIAFVVLWWFRKRKYLFFSLVALLLSYNDILSTVQFHYFRSRHPDKNFLKIMSYNVRQFDYYNWSNDPQTRNKMYHLLLNEAPAIVCLQEFYSHKTKHFGNTDSLADFLSSKNPKMSYSYALASVPSDVEDEIYGSATFTVFPILAKGIIAVSRNGSSVGVWTDLQIGSDTVRVFNVHLQSIHFDNKDYRYIENLVKEKEVENIKGSLKILNRLKVAFLRRSQQVDLISEYLKNSPYPVILCGDFNDSPTSYAYQKFSEKLDDSFRESGWGFGKTYSGAFPSFRIDYILHDQKFNAYEYRTIKEKYSDHFPITCFLAKE